MLPSTRCRFASSSRAPRPLACRTPHPAEPRWAEDRASRRRLSASWSADGVGALQPTLSILSRHLLNAPDARQPPSRLASGSTRRLSGETHFEERAAAFRPSEGGRRGTRHETSPWLSSRPNSRRDPSLDRGNAGGLLAYRSPCVPRPLLAADRTRTRCSAAPPRLAVSRDRNVSGWPPARLLPARLDGDRFRIGTRSQLVDRNARVAAAIRGPPIGF